MPDCRLLSTSEAARYAGIPAATVRQWVKAGTLRVVPSGRHGGRWRVRPGAVDAALRANERALATTAVAVERVGPPGAPPDAPLDDFDRKFWRDVEAVIAGTKR